MEDRLLLRVDEAADALGLGRTKVYELVMSGEIASVKIGRARRVPLDALKHWVRSRQAPTTEDGRGDA